MNRKSSNTSTSTKATRKPRKVIDITSQDTSMAIDLLMAEIGVNGDSDAPDMGTTTDCEGNEFEQDGTPSFKAESELKPKASFRGAGFVKFRAEHDPRWCQKAQKHVHDNEDDLADQLAYEIATFGWWNAPLVKLHLGHKLAELQTKYSRLNAGMVRMNLGNMIRASIRKANKALAEAGFEQK